VTTPVEPPAEPLPPAEPAVEAGPAVGEGPVVEAGPTGHPVVDAALADLSETADRPPAEQVGAYEDTHRVLSQTLSAIDQS
jgi:hypothetical protein